MELAFRRHYDIPQAELRPRKLPSTAHFRLTKLQEALETDLRAVIRMRNKLAYARWAYPLNDAVDDVAQEQMDALRNDAKKVPARPGETDEGEGWLTRA